MSERRVPPNTDEMYWARFVADLDRLGEVAHPGGEDDGALAEIIALAKEPLDLDDDEGGDGEQPPPVLPRNPGTGTSAAAKKKRPKPMKPSFVVKATRAGRLTVDLRTRRVLTASGETVAGGWDAFLTRERAAGKLARERRALAATPIPTSVGITPTTTTSTSGTTVTVTVRPEAA